MKKYLIALTLLWFPIVAAAQEAQEEVNAFGYPDKSLVKVIEVNQISKETKINPKPECNDSKLAALAREAVKPYIKDEQQSIYKKRKNQLILKNIDNFAELELKDINPDNNRKVAGRIVELKINNHLDDANIKVCQTESTELRAKLYLVMYDDKDEVRVDVINIADNANPSFIYGD